MAATVGPGDHSASRRLEGALKLLNVLIGIRLRTVDDPESRRHLVWLNDIVAALGLWNRRTETGRGIDLGDYLESAVGFWTRISTVRRVSIVRPDFAVIAPDVTAAGLSIIAHELLGAAVSRASAEHAGDIVVTLAEDETGLSLTVADQGLASDRPLPQESLELVGGLAEHVGGRLDLSQLAYGAIAVVLPPRGGFDVRH